MPKRSKQRAGPAPVMSRVAQEALKGAHIRTLTKRYNLRSWDVRFALETPRLTTAETGPLADPVTGELPDLIESMIGRKLSGRQIWTELIDHHDYLVTYDSIRHYIRYTRSRQRQHEQIVDIQMRGAPAASRWRHSYKTGSRRPRTIAL